MSGVVATVTKIDNQVAAFAPAIQAGSELGENVPVPQVAAISGLINLVVSIFNALGIFRHKNKAV